ncbi:hypothetical protein CCR85_01360 [Rhodothalassium salexigens]|uniref:phage terminase small subunit n=1 Tax=Rhodothalassium salexigens TaxID=1086 RepID=UPI0019130E34|nr:phage terminase small subunit [Rhodothalassium salexigens]MBK5910140.1 hypothetical protein [Rhodothalassium salexigens]MBK5920762.1 hypothetical protein [Rhodothalassium salexigens]
MSIARDHFVRTRAAAEAGRAAADPAVPGPGLSQASAMLLSLRAHKAALKGIQSRVRKAEAKAGFLPDYAAYVDGVLAADTGQQDTVLVTVMLWRIDAGQYAAAMEIAGYALRHDLAMPDGFSRDLPTALVEELAEHAAAAAEPGAELCQALDTALDLAAERDMPDEVRAKGLKALGGMLQATDRERTERLWSEALSLDPKCGVKTQLERLRKAMATEPETN